MIYLNCAIFRTTHLWDELADACDDVRRSDAKLGHVLHVVSLEMRRQLAEVLPSLLLPRPRPPPK